MSAQRLRSARDAVDHLLLGASDLDRGVVWLYERTGVRATIGGSHPGRGTRNALVALGGRQYLEILAPDPAQPAGLRPDLVSLSEPRLITWAASSDDLPALVRRSRDSGVTVSEPRDGSRARPDGRLLKWRTVDADNAFEANGISPVPFFIQWSPDTVHPSQESPAGCRLERFALRHPTPGPLRAFLERFGIDAVIDEADAVGLEARLATPKGTLVLR